LPGGGLGLGIKNLLMMQRIIELSTAITLLPLAGIAVVDLIVQRTAVLPDLTVLGEIHRSLSVANVAKYQKLAAAAAVGAESHKVMILTVLCKLKAVVEGRGVLEVLYTC
jgi:hypothetical protein